MKKRIISLLLTAVLLLSALPAAAFAAGETDGGDCGAQGGNVTWAVDEAGTLTIRGTGDMQDYGWENRAPWYAGGLRVQNAVIEHGVTGIGSYAFHDCDWLESVSIPDSVTRIGEAAFYAADGLHEIQVSGDNPMYSSEAGVLFNKDRTELVCCPGGYAGSVYHIPDTVTAIGDYAFGISWLQEVTLPDGLIRIGDHAFENCRELENVSIPRSVTAIGDSAFMQCESLTAVTISGAVTDLGSEIFSNCSKLTGVTVGSGTARISDSMFAFCGKLTDVTLPDSIKRIGDGAFAGCGLLKSITLPDGITSIGSSAFYDCESLSEMILPDSVDSIGIYAFQDCDGLHEITVPANVTFLGEGAFYHCRQLERINYNARAAEGYCAFDSAGTDSGGIDVYVGAGVKKFPSCLLCGSYINEMYFAGNAPVFAGDAFYRISPDVRYPYGNDTWTADVMQSYGGYTTWQPYSTAPVDSCEAVAPDKTSYVPGEELDVTGLGMILHHADGFRETVDYASGALTLGAYDLSRPGRQTVTVSCGDAAAAFSLYVHAVRSEILPAANYPESSHDYESNLNETYACRAPGAHCLQVTFSDSTAVETNVDYIYVGGLAYTGTALAGKTITVPGDTLTIRLTSDGSDSAYGFSIDNITAVYVIHEYTAVVTAPTCTAKGYTTYTCACGDSYEDSYTNALGHSWDSGRVTKAATETAAGVRTYTCTRCGATKTETIPKLTPTAPKAPVISISKADGKIKLSWNAVDGATKYWIYRSTDGVNFKYYDTTTKTTYTNSSVTSGTKYYYKVKAIKTVDSKDYIGSFSNMKSTIPLTTPALSISKTAGKIKLSWGAVIGATKYWIYRSTDGVNFKYYDTTTKTSYTNSSVTSGTRYYYKVRAVKTVNGTDWTSSYSGYRSTIPLTTPTLSAKLSSGKVYLSWGAVKGATKYWIYRSTDGVNFKYYDTTTKTSYTNSSVTAGHTYYYKVKAVKTVNGTDWTGDYSNKVSVKR